MKILRCILYCVCILILVNTVTVNSQDIDPCDLPLPCTRDTKVSFPNDCASYYICVQERGQTPTWQVKECGKDQLFDSDKSKCDRNDRVQCSTVSCTQTTESASVTTTHAQNEMTSSQAQITTEGVLGTTILLSQTTESVTQKTVADQSTEKTTISTSESETTPTQKPIDVFKTTVDNDNGGGRSQGQNNINGTVNPPGYGPKAFNMNGGIFGFIFAAIVIVIAGYVIYWKMYIKGNKGKKNKMKDTKKDDIESHYKNGICLNQIDLESSTETTISKRQYQYDDLEAPPDETVSKNGKLVTSNGTKNDVTVTPNGDAGTVNKPEDPKQTEYEAVLLENSCFIARRSSLEKAGIKKYIYENVPAIRSFHEDTGVMEYLYEDKVALQPTQKVKEAGVDNRGFQPDSDPGYNGTVKTVHSDKHYDDVPDLGSGEPGGTNTVQTVHSNKDYDDVPDPDSGDNLGFQKDSDPGDNDTVKTVHSDKHYDDVPHPDSVDNCGFQTGADTEDTDTVKKVHSDSKYYDDVPPQGSDDNSAFQKDTGIQSTGTTKTIHHDDDRDDDKHYDDVPAPESENGKRLNDITSRVEKVYDDVPLNDGH